MGAVLEALPIARFPSPLIEPGRADLRHPALRLDSSHVIRHRVPRRRITWQGSQVHASEEQHAVGPEDFRTRKPTSTAREHLVSTAEEMAHRFVDVIVDGPVGHQACSVAEVSGPPPQHCVEPVTDLGPRIMVAPNQKLIDLCREPPDTFLGRARAQIPTTSLRW